VEAQQLLASKKTLESERKSETSQSDNERENSLQNENQPWSEIEAIAEYYLDSGNFEEAYRLFKLASNLGSKKSCFPLGCMTLSVWGGVWRKQKKGLNYYKRAQAMEMDAAVVNYHSIFSIK
jgi:TPR repeat protein